MCSGLATQHSENTHSYQVIPTSLHACDWLGAKGMTSFGADASLCIGLHDKALKARREASAEVWRRSRPEQRFQGAATKMEFVWRIAMKADQKVGMFVNTLGPDI